MKFKRILVLSPHTDDGELGAGATIARFLEEGSKVHYIAFTAPSITIKGKTYNLVEECVNALKCLGTPRNGVSTLFLEGYKRRQLFKKREEILDYLYNYNKEFKPNLVLVPCSYDNHQDHVTIREEALRVFRQSTIFGYIQRWRCQTVKEDVIVPIQDRHLQAKLASTSQYLSQLHSRRPYFNPEFHRSEAYVRGIMLPSHYAEAFELMSLEIPETEICE